MIGSNSRETAFWDLVYLGVLSCFFMLFGLGSGSLASWDEAIYATVAREMAASGQWLKPTFLGRLWLEKPPLTLWATAFFQRIFGAHEFSARFFSALCGVGGVIITYFLGRKLFGRWTGFLGAAVLLSSSHYFHRARFGMMDAPLAFFLSVALYFFWVGRERSAYFPVSGAALGLALLAKGAAALLFFPIVVIYALAAGETALLRRPLWTVAAFAALVALPWNFYAFKTYPQEAAGDMKAHVFLRAGTALDGHVGNWYFYIRTLINKYHPWILIGVVSGPLFLFQSFRRRQKEVLFLAVWMFTVFIVFTAVRTKLAWYIVPVYPALSLSVAYVLARFLKERHQNLVKLAFALLMVIHIPESHIFSQDYSRPVKALADTVRRVPSGQTVHLYNYHENPAAAYYWLRACVYLDGEAAFDAAASAPGPFFCLIAQKDLTPLEPRLAAWGVGVRETAGDYRWLTKEGDGT